MILIGAVPEPPGGFLLEEVEAALYQAQVLGRVMIADKFVELQGGIEHLGGFL